MNPGKASALLPILTFLLLFIGCGIVFNDFYAMPSTVGFLIALVLAYLQNPKKSYTEKLNIVAQGMGDPNVMIMCLIFILAGGFAGAVQAAGGVESTVNFCLSIIPPKFAVAGLFVIACFISLSMGTAVGTVAALAPIAIGIAMKTGFSPALCLGAIVSGAMFGDNLSIVSDTTIAATRTQGCNMADKFKENFKIILPAAIISTFIYVAITFNANSVANENLEYSFIKILPYLVVLLGSLLGLDIILILTSGIVLSILVGYFTGSIEASQIFTVIAKGTSGNGGISSMYDIVAISMLVAGIIALVKENGGIDFLLYNIRKIAKSQKGAQLSIGALVAIVNVFTANNTVAIVITGPIAKNIAEEFAISPRRSASVLDIFAASAQGMLPYGVQSLYASAGALAVGVSITPMEFLPYLFYPVLMGLSAIIWILLGFGNNSVKA